MISLPYYSSSSHNTSENNDFETFRNMRKASRDLRTPDNTLHLLNVDTSFARRGSIGIKSEDESLEIKDRR